MTTRREFLASVVVAAVSGTAGTANGEIPRSARDDKRVVRRLRVGHTGITWGYAAANAEGAIRDVSSLGYHAFESFGSVLESWESRGGLGRVLDSAKLPLRSAYCPFELTNAAVRREEVAKASRWGALIKKYGGSIAVVGPNSVTRPSYDFKSNRAAILPALSEIGRALEDAGVVGALHPHSGSCIQTSDEVFAVMEAVDTKRIGLAPDVGELLAGGADPLSVVRELLPTIRHVHLKDYNGGASNDGFCPLGEGRVDLAAIVDVLESSKQDMMLMVELNPASGDPARTPLDTARTSRAFLQRLGYAFRA